MEGENEKPVEIGAVVEVVAGLLNEKDGLLTPNIKPVAVEVEVILDASTAEPDEFWLFEPKEKPEDGVDETPDEGSTPNLMVGIGVVEDEAKLKPELGAAAGVARLLVN